MTKFPSAAAMKRPEIVIAGLLLAAALHGAQFVPANIQGVVAGSYFTPPSGTLPSITGASHYQGAKVCLDANNNAVCDVGEASAISDSEGKFALTGLNIGPIVAEIPTTAVNGGHAVVQRVVFRASQDQVADGAAAGKYVVVVSPLSAEVVRISELNGLSFQQARQNLAARLTVPVGEVLSDPGTETDVQVQNALLKESVLLTNRFAFAARMVDRHDVAPAALAANPNATGPLITLKEAQQAAMNLEWIPRYDHIFIIMLENKATSSIKDSSFAPAISAYLRANNQFTSYYATGNPSEPNYTALALADDFGITDDSAWNCVPAGDSADLPTDPLPAGMTACTNATNHNIKNQPNLFSALTAGGMTWRVYNESTNAGRDVRRDGTTNSSVVAFDHVYPSDSPVGAIGNPNLVLPFPSGLYATKHNPPMPIQSVRSAPEFFSSNRTMGGGQWDDAIKTNTGTPPDWNVDQLGSDLLSGDVGNLNFLVPDQCDDMHATTVRGTVPPSTTQINASDCGGNQDIYRGDLYVDYLIKKIQASPVWMNTQKRSAIVIMFDEATATTGFNSCCGWNPSAGSSIAGKSLGPLVKNPEGTVSANTTIARYNQGNKGHGASIFGVLTNQSAAPKGIVDSDAYSHMSFTRTLQDMFQLADPKDDWSYFGRSKYTEPFIAANLASLPEYAASADPHFDAVRPMNHAYVIPPGYVQKNGFPAQQIGPDANQINVWAMGVNACGTSVTDQVVVTRSGFRFNAGTQRYVQSVSLRNAGTEPINGLLSLVLDGVSNASLFNRTGLTACGAPGPTPFINVGSGVDQALAPGQSLTITLEFTNPANQGITYATRVLVGNTNY